MPARRAVPGMLRDVHAALLDAANSSDGEVVRIGLGLSRPYLVTHPAHVQQVLAERPTVYQRGSDTALWRSVRRVVGDGILGEGEEWTTSRKVLAPLFRPARITGIAASLVATVADAVQGIEAAAATATPVDMAGELTRIVAGVSVRTFFADRLSLDDALRITEAQATILTAMIPRVVAPFVPWWLPMPGDRRFHASVRTIDDILLPVLRRAVHEPTDGDDVLSMLVRARAADGDALPDRRMRDDLVSMVAVATETSQTALTWLWPVLAGRPDVTARLTDEIDRVVGAGPVRAEHLTRLTYTGMVLTELLRLYPPGWILPRRATTDDVLGGVRIPKGATVLLSPYATARMPQFWGPTAGEFDPDRFAPGRAEAQGRHRYAHFPFGGGMHRCVGEHLFHLQATLIVATVLHRFQFTAVDDTPPGVEVAGLLRARQPVSLTFTRRQRDQERV
ncbi:cytochrome P450 [Micromonospora sp. NPDC000207]|uniref:cytochrome P450 n=1 Tax=Micromonospora sp. NPDC000207 TaxID=3154246 RepID=UPI003321F4B8